MTARDLLPGQVLLTRTGPVRVLSRTEHRGGVELVVCPAFSKAMRPEPRILWFWGTETVTLQGDGAPPGDYRAAGEARP